MHHDDGARPLRDPLTKRMQVQVPAMTAARIVQKAIRHQLHVIDRREQIEERITRLRNQHLVPRIAEQPEEPAISLARAGGEKDLLCINPRAVVGIVAAYRPACTKHAPRIGIVRACALRR